MKDLLGFAVLLGRNGITQANPTVCNPIMNSGKTRGMRRAFLKNQ
jgi:hypothetical protein